MGCDRDFAGYRGNPPSVRWPNDARLALSIVVNVEEGAELSIGMGDEANEFVHEAVERVDGVRDLCMESHYEYGTRAGWPRIRELLQDYGVRATLNASGRALALLALARRRGVGTATRSRRTAGAGSGRFTWTRRPERR